MARLILSEPDGKRSVVELSKSLLTVGRSSANDVVLNDTSVSRYHAVVKISPEGAVTIADCGSTNGVLINGNRIAQETAFSEQDSLRVGIYELRLEVPKEEAPLLIQKVQINSDINNVLRGETGAKRQAELVGGSAAELDKQVRNLERENFLLRMLYDAGKTLSSKLSIDGILDEVLKLAFRIGGVERGFVTLLDENGQTTRQSEVRYRRPPKDDQPKIVLSRAILQKIREEMEPILIMDMAGDERFNASVSMKISGLRSAMVAPLTSGGWGKSASETRQKRMFGVFYVDNLERSAAFTQEEMNVFAVVAAQAAAAIENALNRQEMDKQALQRSALERFLAPEVVEMISANPEGIRLGGTNQKITVLFADIRGFTTISERMPPETVVEVLNDYFTRVTDVIFDNGGTLDKYLGDGVMAVFGAPISKGNDAVSAVRAAIEIQRLLISLNRDAPARGWPELKVGIGINTGIATAGNIGSPRRIDYTVVGDAVNVSARLMANAAGGQILISEATAIELGPEFRLTVLPPLLVKGKSEPVHVSAVTWLKAQTEAIG